MGSLQKIILISAGDPASIASEITIKAIQYLLVDNHLKTIVISEAILAGSPADISIIFCNEAINKNMFN